MQSGPRFLTEFDINQTHALSNLTPGSADGQTGTGFTVDDLGQIGQTNDGRFYRLVSVNSSTTVAPGQLLSVDTVNSDYYGLAIAASQPTNTAYGNADNNATSALRAGSLSFTVVNGSAKAVTSDQFQGGTIEVLQTSGTDNGPETYRVAGNTSAAEGADFTVFLSEPLAVASALVAGTDTVNLRTNPFADVAAGTTGQAVGVLNIQVPAYTANSNNSPYGVWAQVVGPAVVGCSGAVTAFDTVALSTATAGDVEAVAAATQKAIGVALQTLTAAGDLSVNLSLL
jgi:hypothetical protein